MLRKWFAICLALVLTLSLCSAVAAQDDGSLDKILADGVLVMGLDDSFPPMGYRDEDNKIVGFDVDLATEVTARLGVELKLQPIEWSAKELELNSGNIDCIWNGMTITGDRLESMSISVAYLGNDQILIVLADGGLATLADMEGKKLGLQSGSSAEDALDDNPDFKATLGDVLKFEENLTAMMDLDNGGVEAVLMDKVVAEYMVANKQGSYQVLAESLAPEYYGIGFRKADIALTNAVNDTLKAMADDGALAEISTLWFGSDVTTVANPPADPAFIGE